MTDTKTSTQVELEYTYLETNSITLHVVQAGPKDGDPVLMLHGFPEFWYGYHKQIQALAAAGFRVWVPDQRGYNLSDKPKAIEAYRMKELVADMIGLIDQTGHEKVNLVGHDWGGGVAWTLAMRHADRIKRLAILNSPHPLVYANALRSDPRQMLRSTYWGLFQLPVLPELMLAGGDANGAAQMLFLSSKRGTFTDADMAAYTKAWKRPGAMTAMLNWYRAVGRSPGSAMPTGDMRVHVPTLLIWGLNDVALDPSLVQPSIDLCDDGRVVTFPDAGHWVAHEKTDEVNQLLIEFFKPE